MPCFMKNYLIKFASLCVLVFSLSTIQAQNGSTKIIKTSKATVIMQNGDEYVGQILSKTDNLLILLTENGELNLIASNVKSIEENTYTGRFGFPNPHETRYFFGPSAIPIKKGKGYYQNVYVTLNFVNYGISKNFSIGGGLEFISTVTGNPIYFLTPKVGFEVAKNVHVGGGVLLAGFSTFGAASLIYTVGTYGNSESNVTGGIGYGFVDATLTNNPAIMFSGTHRLSRGLSLLSENYLLPVDGEGPTYFSIQGIRIVGKNSAFDLGALILTDIGFPLPYVSYARTF